MVGARGRAAGDAGVLHRGGAHPDLAPIASNRPVRARRATMAIAGALAVVSGLTGCSLLAPAPAPATVTVPAAPAPTGSMTDPSADPSGATTGPTSAASTPPPTGTAAPSNVSTLPGGNGTAMRLVLPTSALPAGWADAEPRETGGYRMTVCGVDLEPASPLDAAQRRWQRAASGPFLEQHVRVYSGHTARDVVARLRAALPACSSYRQGAQTFTVRPITATGAGRSVAAWRQSAVLPLPTATPTATGSATTPATPAPPTATGSATSAAPTATLVQDVAVLKVGSSVVLVSSYAVDTTPQPDVLAAAVRGAARAGR